MEPPDKSGNPAGLHGLPVFGQNFSTHFLSGLQNFASQELVNKLQKISQSSVQYGDIEGVEEKDEDAEKEGFGVTGAFEQEVKVYTDELKNMCEYTCQICGKIMNAYYLRKHVRDHNMSMTTYKELYGKVQFTKLSFHRCRICQNVIKANYITIMKHLKCVHNVSFKDYKRKFNIFVGKESKQMFKETEGEMDLETDRTYSDKSVDMCKVLCKICDTDFPTHQFRFHVKSKHKMTFDEYREKNGTLEIHNRVYHRCKVCFKVLLFQYEKLASHVTDSHGLKMSAYVRLYLERPARAAKPSKTVKDKPAKKPKPKVKIRKTLPRENVSTERPRTRGKVKEEEGIQSRFTIKRELEEILMNQEIGEVEESEDETRKSRRKKPRKKITRLRRRPKEEVSEIYVEDIKEEVITTESEPADVVESILSEVPVKQEDLDVPSENVDETKENPPEVTESMEDEPVEKQSEAEDKEDDGLYAVDESNTEVNAEASNKIGVDKKVQKVDDSEDSLEQSANEVVKKEVKQAEMVFSDNPEEMCLCQCSFCDKVIPYDLLRKHVTSKHGKVKDDYGEYKYIRLTYHRCKKCNLEILFSYNNIKLHLNRFHKMSIVEYQQSVKGFSGKVVNLRTLKAMYEEDDGGREAKKTKLGQADRRSYGSLISPDRTVAPRFESVISPERKQSRRDYDDRSWYDGNTFSCKEDCSFSSHSLDRFEEHIRQEHRATLDSYKGRYSNTSLSLQCEYCGEHVYHELRSIQHHLDSHYLTLEQYQAHYLRSKIDEPLSLSSGLQSENAASKLPSAPSHVQRMEQPPLTETQSLNQAFSETSTLLDHLKRSELFRTSSEKQEEFSSESYRSGQDSFRTQDPISFQTNHDHFRPFADQDSGAGLRNESDVYKTMPRNDYEQDFVRSLATGMETDRDQFGSPRTFNTPGLPIDYSQHVAQRDTFQPKQQQQHAAIYKDDIYAPKSETFSPKENSYSPRLDNYPTAKTDMYIPREENYSPKSDIFASVKAVDSFGSIAGKAVDKFAENQKLNQENYFRYVTSQLHEYYNRRQTEQPVEPFPRDVSRTSDAFPRDISRPSDAFQQNYARQEPFVQGVPRPDLYGYRRENF